MVWYTRFYKIFLTLSLLAYFQTSFAWNFIGHAVIAQIAYDNLTPTAKKHVDELVVTFAHVYPDSNSFQKMADWPDHVRQDNMNQFNSWHFVNKPFSLDGSRLPYYEYQNVIWAIMQNENSLAQAKNPFNQAMALAFLSHFIGDIAQPLHCATRVTHQHPKGDQGGNLYRIRSPIAKDLHDLWDQGLGLYVYSPNKNVGQQINQLTHTIETRYPKNYFANALKDNDPKHWANYSFDIAKNFAYTTPEHHEVSAEYISKGQEIVMKQSATAGYRLAEVLNKVFGS